MDAVLSILDDAKRRAHASVFDAAPEPAMVVPMRSIGGRPSELPVSLAERIRAADAKTPAELSAIAAEVKDAMQDLSDLEPEIREMLLRRQRAIAKQENPSPPSTPELKKTEPEKPKRVLRACCCGCGAMLVCGSSMDAEMTEMCLSQLADSQPPPKVSASAQRAYSERLSKKKEKKPKPAEPEKEKEMPAAPAPTKLLNYEHLHEMAKPREQPPPPPPEPAFRALPAPSYIKAFKRPAAELKPSASAPALQQSPSAETSTADNARIHLPQLTSVSAGVSSQLAELHCHALKSKGVPRSPAARYGLPMAGMSSLLGDDWSDDLFGRPAAVRKHVSASEQRRYTDNRLYRKPSHGPPGSVADLQAKLEALRRENRGTHSAEKDDLERERRKRERLYKKSLAGEVPVHIS